MLNNTQAACIIGRLSNIEAFPPYPPKPWSNQPMKQLWGVLDALNLSMRMPLHHQYLGKRVPKSAEYQLAETRGLALLGACAAVLGTRQAIVSSSGGYVRSISFQPRPGDANWTARYAYTPAPEEFDIPRQAYRVELSDVFFLAAKLMHVIIRAQAGSIPDVVGTFIFYPNPVGVDVCVRNLRDHRTWSAALR